MLIIFIVGTHRAKVAAPGAAATAPIPALAEVPAAVLVHRNAAWHRQGAAFLEDESELLAPPATAIVTATCVSLYLEGVDSAAVVASATAFFPVSRIAPAAAAKAAGGLSAASRVHEVA